MTNGAYDIITVGGGLGGATLAKVMAEQGAKVLVLEREQQCKDRVRGEVIWPWGVAELKELGSYELLRTACGHDLLWFDTHLGPARVEHRDLANNTVPHVPALNFYHPEMQEILLQAAADAGAKIRRGAWVCDVKPGAIPTVTVEQDGHIEEIQARLIVGADGKASMARKWSGFSAQRDTIGLMVAGVLLEGMQGPQENTNYWIINPQLGQAAFLAPQRDDHMRAYLLHAKIAEFRLQGEQALPRFTAEMIKSCAPAEWFTGVKAIGPLATFDGTDTWVRHPYKAGVVLVGDAAACTDPSYGQGMCLTLRDVRVLRDHLLSQNNWESAGYAYAEEHDWYYSVLNTVIHWFWDLFYEVGAEAEARRVKAFPSLAQDVTRIPDVLLSGPEVSMNETVRRRFFGEE